MKTKSTISLEVVENVPDFQVSDRLLEFLKNELNIKASESDRVELRRIVRNYMADQKRNREALEVDTLVSVLDQLSIGSRELLKLLQGGTETRRGAIRRFLIAGANDRPLSADDNLRGTPDEVVRPVIGGAAIDNIQVALLLLSRASRIATGDLKTVKNQGSKGTQPGAFGVAWRMFVPDIMRWVEERGGSTKLGRNDTDKFSGAYVAKPFVRLVRLILEAELPSDYQEPVQSDIALMKQIREAKLGGKARPHGEV